MHLFYGWVVGGDRLERQRTTAKEGKLRAKQETKGNFDAKRNYYGTKATIRKQTSAEVRWLGKGPLGKERRGVGP